MLDKIRKGQRWLTALIVVGVGLDTISQVEAHLVSRQYEGFAQGTRIRGRLAR